MGLTETGRTSKIGVTPELKRRPPLPDREPWDGRRILFVCDGARARSAMARGLFHARHPDISSDNVDNAGVNANPLHQTPHELAIEVMAMAKEGIDISGYPPRKLSIQNLTPETDIVGFVYERFLRPYVPYARSVTVINVYDPWEVFVRGREPSLKDAIIKSYEVISGIIFRQDLQDYVVRAREKSAHSKTHGIYQVFTGQTLPPVIKSQYINYIYKQELFNF